MLKIQIVKICLRIEILPALVYPHLRWLVLHAQNGYFVHMVDVCSYYLQQQLSG